MRDPLGRGTSRRAMFLYLPSVLNIRWKQGSFMRQASTEHRAAWTGHVRQEGEPRLSKLQSEARAALDSLAAERKFTINWQYVEPKDSEWGGYLHAEIEGHVGTWLHDDTLSLQADNFELVLEHWDFESPQAMIKKLSEALTAAIDNA